MHKTALVTWCFASCSSKLVCYLGGVNWRGGLLTGLWRASQHLAMLKKFFWTTIISHVFIFCHSYGFFTVIPFFFLTGSTSVCYKPTSPVQVLEDTGFLYQDHQLFAGRHEVSPLTAEVISAKEKAGKFMATLLYELTAFTSRFSPKHKSSSLSHLQIIFTELKASFSFFLESKLLLTCVWWPTISFHLYLWRVQHLHFSFRTWLLFTAQLDQFPRLFCWWSKTMGTVESSCGQSFWTSIIGNLKYISQI